MKKSDAPQLLAASLVGLAAMLAAAKAVNLYVPQWGGFVLSGLCTVLAIISQVCGKKRTAGYALCILWNFLGAGSAVGVFYHYQPPFPEFGGLIGVFVVWAAFLLIFGLAAQRTSRLWLPATAGVLWLAAQIVNVVFWSMGRGPAWSLSFYLGVAALFFLLGAAGAAFPGSKSQEEEDSPWMPLALCSYGVYWLILLVILLVLSEGDCCDGCDCPWEPKKKARK